jgi:hypothetical protein
MKKNLNPYIRNAWRGLSGFCLGGIVGALVTFLIFNAGLLSILVEMVSPDQVYPRFSWGIFLAFIGIGLGGAVAGLICGYSLAKLTLKATG